MREVITKIEEVEGHEIEFKDLTEKGCPYSWRRQYDGYKITTTEQEILVLIENGQTCCEQSGYLSSNDNLQDFVGSELARINITTPALKTYTISPGQELSKDEAIFVTFECWPHNFQLVVYNHHNGYYGHQVLVHAEQLKLETNL